MNPFVRSRRAVWGDVRFLIGIALVLLSVGGVWAVLSSAGTTTPVLQANRTLVTGEPLVSADFQVIEVNLGTLTDRYLAPQDLDSGSIASRAVEAGELMSKTAARPAAESRWTTIVVESSTGIPDDVVSGSVVDLWHAPTLDDRSTPEPPRILVTGATVASVTKTEGMLAGSGTEVEVVIDRADVAEVLAAITGGSLVSVVPIGAGS
ncbi:hypothetical protein J7E68_13605 [Microbacterium sp. ISL-103]|uniref:hypothetical protein n=1 Tax=Microbacterium sp. ISL-103 TaxID=2819156 RepID=UPI001BE6DF3E|nr:hypothetical protein [Microbacterium sp. ISL-103]MBT2475576.1 hypothetical protein [Microbacterium sp. ISL-103]